MNIEVFLQIFLWFKFCMSAQICIYLSTFVLIYSWVSLEPFSVILSGGQLKMYWWLYCTGASKSHEIAHICCQTQGQHIQWNFFSVWWQCIDLELTPSEIYDVTWNPRIHYVTDAVPLNAILELYTFPVNCGKCLH